MATARAVRRRQPAPVANPKRKAILQGARAVFLEHGFGGASMDEIASAAGASKMTVYRHFENKEELFAEIITELCSRIVDPDIARRMDALPPDDALRLFASRMLAIVLDPETIGLHRVVIAEARRFPDLGRMFYQQGPTGSIKLLGNYLKKHSRDPRLKVTDPIRDAEAFMSLLRGYLHLRVLLDLGHTANDERQAIETAVAHLVR